MNEVDIDKNGYIEYSEFLAAAVNKEKAFSLTNLRLAFGYFDADKSGKISVDELKLALGMNYSDDVYKNMIKEFDSNQDGEISFDEFTKMMNMLTA